MSAGSWLVAACVLLAAAFFAWGLGTPPLDDAWRVQIELATSDGAPLSDADRESFQRTLWRHPSIADDMLDGARWGIVSAHDDDRVQAGHSYLVARAAVQIEVKGRTCNDTVATTGPFPQLVEIHTDSPATVRVRGAP